MKPLGDLISFITKDHIIKMFYTSVQKYDYCSVCKLNIFYLKEYYSFVEVTHLNEYYYHVSGYCYICQNSFDLVYDKCSIQNVFYELVPTIDI